MEQLTEEQKKQYKAIVTKFALKSVWNGIHHALMAVAMNLVFLFGMVAMFDWQTAGSAQFFGGVAIGIFVISRMASIQRQNTIDFKESVAKILK